MAENNLTSKIDCVDQTINRTIQAQAILSALLNAGQHLDKGFGELTHSTVLHCLWAVKTLVEQAQESAEKIAASAQ